MMGRSLFLCVAVSMAVHATVLGTAVWLWRSGGIGEAPAGERVVSLVRIKESPSVVVPEPRPKPALATGPMPMPETGAGQRVEKVNLRVNFKPRQIGGIFLEGAGVDFHPAADETRVLPVPTPVTLPASQAEGEQVVSLPQLPPATLATEPPAQGKVTYARLLRAENPVPDYLRQAARPGQRGVALLLVTVNEHGAVVEVKLEQSSGLAAFDRAAARAVRGWPFVAARLDDRPVQSQVRVPVRLDGGR